MLRALPECRAESASRQLATDLFTAHYGIDAHGMKIDHVDFVFEAAPSATNREPHPSRAYPISGAKGHHYSACFVTSTAINMRIPPASTLIPPHSSFSTFILQSKHMEIK
jgi:hypothetical protein